MNRFKNVVLLAIGLLLLSLNVNADKEDEASSVALETKSPVVDEVITDEDVAAFQKAKKQPPASGDVKVERVHSKDSFKKVPKNKAVNTEETKEGE